MKILVIRRFALLAALTLVVVGCKRDVQNQIVVDENELTFTAAIPLHVDRLSNAPAKSESTLEEFVTGSAIGLYSQLKSESDANSTVVMKSNSLYTYSVPVWSPNSKDAKLTYDAENNQPIYLFGYYPHPSMSGSTTAVAEGSNIVEFTLHKDQSSPNAVRTSDLLWVGARNGGTGYVRQRSPLSLQFQHCLTKVSFYIRLIDSKPSANNPNKVYLRSLTTMGEQITSTAKLNALTGVITPTYPAVPLDSIIWNSTSQRGVELTVGEDPLFITDMLVVPFKAVKSKNYFRSIVYYESTVPGDNFEQNFNAYIPEHDPSATAGNAGMLNFESNKHNKVTITIDISDKYANIRADIAPWGKGPEVDLPAERD